MRKNLLFRLKLASILHKNTNILKKKVARHSTAKKIIEIKQLNKEIIYIDECGENRKSFKK